MSVSEHMRREWNERAQENAYHWVVSEKKVWDPKDYYEQGRKDVARLVLPLFAKAGVPAEALRSLRALEIGCGTGRISRALSQHFGYVTGVDIAPEMIERAHRENADCAAAEFLLTSGQDLSPVRDQSVDFCFSYIVFQHIPDKRVIEKYFREIRRVLKPGGYAKVQVRGTPGNPPGKVLWYFGFARLYVAVVLWRQWLPIPWIRPYDTVYGACYTASELQKLVERTGFSDVCTYHETPKYLWVEMRNPA